MAGREVKVRNPLDVEAGGADQSDRRARPEQHRRVGTGLLTRIDSKQEHLEARDMPFRERVVYESERLWWATLVIVLVIVDLAVFLADMSKGEDDLEATRLTTTVSLVISVLLSVEWILRCAAIGPKEFLCCMPISNVEELNEDMPDGKRAAAAGASDSASKLPVVFAWVDFVASFGGLTISAITLATIQQIIGESGVDIISVVETSPSAAPTSDADSTSALPIARYFSFITIIRLMRIVRLFLVIFTTRSAMVEATRRLVSQNRRRFKSAEFDLDLTYITDGLIAMSLPAHKRADKLYRNYIGDEARFFQTRHKDNFAIYNVTSERRYDHSWFKGGMLNDRLMGCRFSFFLGISSHRNPL